MIDTYEILIDSEYKYLVDLYKWKVVLKKGTPYVWASKGSETLYLAREILGNCEGLLVDHINGNTLDNRVKNLRLATKSQNAMNMKSNKNSTSKYKGVSYDKNRNKWRANIFHNNKQIHLGRFNSELEAAIAYNDAAIIYYEEYARLNVVEIE